ncbi:MAG: radical SAM family heme chaperone HemW [Paracoccus sp. (in: a-proteobacteria)]|uniref:radical SAM family heme chaperone HemW n=1 Tax=Paracoccus sp. TaxID=267 RepID=UPI0026DFAD3A|nr:radical SAM family heme chaperone HemW [Paracoccus sp. (in: a-proteobacteria)]MDO5621649.1 radical SAM family heme chaperone HemW [Paracoccus sp. (in: a-proteobacteria)]
MTEDWRAGGFGLYVHWPFCASKCPYCDFNSHVAGSVDHARWSQALVSEVARQAAETPGRVLNSIFFGGGTPSLMQPETVAAVIDAARAAWGFANDIEITLEANPTSVEAGRFRGFSDAGVNRVSMGIQALNDDDLRALGRMHSVAEARQAFDIARSVFRRVSFDLIYARQGQSRDMWQSELRQALDMAVDHLSLYQLTIEPETAFGRRHAAGGLRGLPSDDLAADMYFDTQEICESAGMPAYEVSNHARAGAESRHNLIYWRQGDWAAVGPGAHGRLTIGQRWATEAAQIPDDWLSRAEAGNAEVLRETVPNDERATELLLMGLRLREGVSLDRYAALAGPLPETRLRDLDAMGMVQVQDGRLVVTTEGRPVLNAILRELLA